MSVPYTFASATGSIPLSQLDSNFATAITIGNTSVLLGGTITTLNNLSLGNVAITSVNTQFPNGYLANSNVVIGTTTINLGSTVTTIDGLTIGNVTIATANVTTANVGTLAVIGNATIGGNVSIFGNTVDIGQADANSTIVNVGAGATGNRFALTDYVGDTTYTDYGLRVGRVNDGANGTSRIQHRGTGGLDIGSFDAGFIRFLTSNIERMRIDAGGNVSITGNVSAARANVSGTANVQILAVTANATIAGNAAISGNVTALNGFVTIGNTTVGLGNTTATLGNTTVSNTTVTLYTESVVAIGNSSTSKTLDLTNGTFQTVTMTGNCTFTMPTATAGRSFILVVSTGAGGFTGTFTSVKWANNAAPTLTTTASRWDILTFFSDGTNWYGTYAQAFQ
jgi:hypothetical protein